MADSEENEETSSERPEDADHGDEETPAKERTDGADADPSAGADETSDAETSDETTSEEGAASDSEVESDGSEDGDAHPDDDAEEAEASADESDTEASDAASTERDREEDDASSDAGASDSGDGDDGGGDDDVPSDSADSGDGGDDGDDSDDGDDDGETSELDAELAGVVETVRQRRPEAGEGRIAALRDELAELEPGQHSTDRLVSAAVLAIDADVGLGEVLGTDAGYERREAGVAAFFDHPDRLLAAARRTRESTYEEFDAYSPFPIHGMDEAMGLERSWMPWVTFFAGLAGFMSAVALEFGTMTFDWPMIIGGKPYAPWPAFVPVMFELTVLIGGVTTGVVMLRAAGCFEPADVLDPAITDDRFALWISGEDEDYDPQEVIEFVEQMNPDEVRTFTEES